MFAETCYYLRKRKNLTQEQLADALGVSRQAVSKWETGEAYPETDKLIMLCDLFGVTADELLRGNLASSEPCGASGADGNDRSDCGSGAPVGGKAETENGKDASEVGEPRPKADPAEYKRKTDAFSVMTALGVGLVLVGVAICVLCGAFERQYGEMFPVIGAACLLAFVAVAVFLFVYGGISVEAYDRKYAAGTLPAEVTEEFNRKFALRMAVLIAGILLDVVALVLLTAFFSDDTPQGETVSCMIVAGFLAVLAVCVGGIVCLGIRKGRYDPERPDHAVSGKKGDPICAVIMLSATAAFLTLGFLWGVWHPAWIVFPVGGILCGIVGVITDRKK